MLNYRRWCEAAILAKQLHTLMAHLQQSLKRDGLHMTLSPALYAPVGTQDVPPVEVLQVSGINDLKDDQNQKQSAVRPVKSKAKTSGKTPKARKRSAKKSAQSSSQPKKKPVASTKLAKGPITKLVSRWFSS
jgi:hypothetical protein